MSSLDYFSKSHPLANFRSTLSLSARKKIFNLFVEKMQPKVGDRVLDLGATPDIDLPDSNFFEKFYSYREQITAASIEDISILETIFPGVSTVKIAPGSLPFEDNEFDLLFCSAVIEHVGDFANQEAFLNEIIRVSKRFFITTPNRWHPVEFHTILPFLHWLPKKMHRYILKKMGYRFLSQEENLNLLSVSDLLKMKRPTSFLNYNYIWFAGFPSNIILYGDKSIA